ncbi:MAG: HAD family hydrolase [Candidatus Omnitrophica bacterium]|nr:HAD family hydrolase [Candidatus Omnitrophota bacterium]
MKRKQLFIFDVDGTLVNSYRAIEKSLNYTRRQFGYSSITSEKVKKSVGRGDKPFVGLFFPQVHVEEALKMYRKHHEKALIRYSCLYPRTKQLLSSLKKRKKILAIASNRPAYFTNLLIKSLDIKKYFNAVYCADKIKSLKPDPKIIEIILKRFCKKRKEAVYIGDMDIDMETAKRAKVDAVFKKGGSSSLISVKKYKKRVIKDLTELLFFYN